jgi:hypothetical protein
MNQDSTPRNDEAAYHRRSILEKFVTDGVDLFNSGIPVEQFTAKDTEVLLDFPVFAARELLEKVKDRSTQAPLVYGGEAESFEDVLDLIHVAKLLRAELGFIAAPNHPALPSNLSMALFTAMANYLMLVDALDAFLSSELYEFSKSWESTMDLVLYEIPDGLHFQFLLKHVWLGLAIHIVNHYYNSNLSGDFNTDSDLFPQYKIQIVSNKNQPLNRKVLFQIHNKYQTFYTLSMNINTNYIIKAQFKYKTFDNTPSSDTTFYLRHLIDNIITTRNDIMNIITIIKSQWTDFIQNMKHYVITDTADHHNWMHSILETPEYIRFSFIYSELRKSVISLTHDIQSDPHLTDLCNEYIKKYKDYIPDYVLSALEIAYVEINDILANIRTKTHVLKDEHTKASYAMRYMKAHPDRFKILPPDQVSHAIKTYFGHTRDKDSTGNETRDIREYVLQVVARNLGREIPKLTIRNLTKSMK